MKNFIRLSTYILICLIATSCWKYSFNKSIDIGDAKTIQIDFFPNQASLIEPNLSQRFTREMQEFFIRQTKLEQVRSDGDLHFEGEIVDYKVNPMSATSQQTASQNRLTITINVHYYNRLKEEDNFEKRFSFYSDFDANTQLTGRVLDSALEEILERIIQDIFNTSLAKWKI